jgi:hypothetical protein
MAEPMTPERRTEIERLNSKCFDSHDWEWHAFNELLAEMNVLDRLIAENARLGKVVDQAIECGLVNPPSFKYQAELAAELERRSKA